LPGAIIATATTQRLQRKSKLIKIMDGTYTYRNSSSTKALSTTNDGAPRFSALKYQYGRHVLGAAYQHHSLCSRHRRCCRFFEVAKGADDGYSKFGCEDCCKKTLEQHKTRERAAEREDKAFVEQELVNFA
jgi:hypothetical protein